MKSNLAEYKYLPILKGVTSTEDINWLGKCIDAKVKQYESGEIIAEKGQEDHFIRYIVEGTVLEEETGQTIGDFQLLYNEKGLDRTAVVESTMRAKTDCKILEMRRIRANRICNFQCEFHKVFLENLNQEI